MNRMLAATFALILTMAAVSSACFAEDLGSAAIASHGTRPFATGFRPLASLRFVDLGGGLYSASRP